MVNFFQPHYVIYKYMSWLVCQGEGGRDLLKRNERIIGVLRDISMSRAINESIYVHDFSSIRSYRIRDPSY